MDEQERDEILYRLDERTERVDDHLKRLERRVGAAEEALDQHDERISSNEYSLSNIRAGLHAVGLSMLAAVSGIGAKLLGFL